MKLASVLKLATVGLIALCMPRSTARQPAQRNVAHADQPIQADKTPPASAPNQTLSGQ